MFQLDKKSKEMRERNEFGMRYVLEEDCEATSEVVELCEKNVFGFTAEKDIDDIADNIREALKNSSYDGKLGRFDRAIILKMPYDSSQAEVRHVNALADAVDWLRENFSGSNLKALVDAVEWARKTFSDKAANQRVLEPVDSND